MRGIKRDDALVYADALDCAAKLLAWRAAELRVNDANQDKWLLAAALNISLANHLRDTK